MHPYLTSNIPKRSSRAILSYVPHGIWLLDDIEDLENVLVLNFSQFFVDLFFFGDVLDVRHALLNLADGDGIFQVAVENTEDLN